MAHDDLRSIVEAVVRAVLARLTADPGATSEPPARPASDAPAPVLALFTAARCGLEETTQSLRRVERAGYPIHAVLSNAAKDVFGTSVSAEGLGVTRILPAEFPADMTAFLSPYKVVVLPTLTRTTAAKLAWGITDTAVTQIVYSALAAERPVVAVKETVLPADPAEEWGNSLPYVQALNHDYLNRLSELGVRTVSRSALVESILEVLNGRAATRESQRGVITLEDVQDLKSNEIAIEEGSIVTDLAAEFLRENGIRIRWVAR